VLDFRFAGRGSTNRWNALGEPTLYLAGDRGVALAEFARHFSEDRAVRQPELVIRRQVFRLTLSLGRTLDLRQPDVCDALSLREAPYCFLDKAVARAVAGFLRRTTAAQALLVPSVAFLDDPSRFALAVFLEKLPPDPSQVIRRAERDGLLVLDLSVLSNGP
jgi:RES domain-containing protein